MRIATSQRAMPTVASTFRAVGICSRVRGLAGAPAVVAGRLAAGLPAEELIEERPESSGQEQTKQMRYLG